MKPLVVIPARGGSKRLPKKNLKLLNGKPLIHYTIEAARGVFDDNIICVSTDDEEIKKVAEQTGLKIPFIRPAELATDFTDSRSVLLHAYEYYVKEEKYEASEIVLLQPTSPLRNAIHIRKALELYNENLDMVVSVKETNANPYFVLYEENDSGYLKKSKAGDFSRKQDCPKVWEFNGAIYVINSISLKKTNFTKFNRIKKFVMNQYSSIDIDTAFDLLIADIILDKNIY